MQRGVHFSSATGWSPREVRQFLHQLALAVPVIGLNGAMVEDRMTGEIVHGL